MLVRTELVSDGMIGAKLIFFEQNTCNPNDGPAKSFFCRKTRVKLPPLYALYMGETIRTWSLLLINNVPLLYRMVFLFLGYVKEAGTVV